MWIYALALLAILGFRFFPGLWPETKAPSPQAHAPESLAVAGLDLAPNLIPQLLEEYRADYPWVRPVLLPGGTRQALEHLLNRRAALAVLSRPPTSEELALIASIGDTVETFSIAVGGIAVLSAQAGGRDSVATTSLRRWLGGTPDGSDPAPRALYAPDPNLGLWESLASGLGLPMDADPGVRWLADERAVAQAVGADPGSIGFASTLALPERPEEFGARLVSVRGDTAERAALPFRAQIARGEYPLFHYLYLAMLPQPASAASGFVTFVFSNRGQRLVRRQGFVPARQTARLIQLASRPLG
jgi:phosphate transport system substrate-binding protein